MKRCLLMFTLLVIALVIAVLTEGQGEIIPEDRMLLGEHKIENVLLAQD